MLDVRKLLTRRPLLFDGGMGTYYKAKPGQECEQANLLDPDGILTVHRAYLEAGADAIFAEAMTDITMYRKVVDAVGVPVLANITEFGSTPYYTVEELGEQGIGMVLYPLSATRAMQKAALQVMRAIREQGTQVNVLDVMQPRSELYEFLNYHSFEHKLDQPFKQEK